MVVLPINRIEIDFPYQPYGAQIQYMSKVIDALRNGHNALLESPTGTGKTLSLLCATLAWRSAYNAALQASVRNAPNARLNAAVGLRTSSTAGEAIAGLFNSNANAGYHAPRILYSSRTHSQLAQAVHELKDTVYKPGMVMLASRDQLCIHEISSRASGARLNALCRKLTAPGQRHRGCQYYEAVCSPVQHKSRCDELIEKLHNEPMDIEDLREFGSRETACPFFLSRAASQTPTCEIIFLPYNYLLDRNARSSLDIDWTNDILIIDEAHNLEGVCSNSMSFDLTKATRAGCDSELLRCVEKGARPMGVSFPALEKLAESKEGLDAVLGSENQDMLEYRIMRTILSKVEEFIGSVRLKPEDHGTIDFAVFPSKLLRDLFEQSNGPTEQNFDLYVDLLDRAIGLLSTDGNERAVTGSSDAPGNLSNSKGSNPLRTLQTAIQILFETCKTEKEDSFKMVVHQDRSKQNQGRTLSYWCFDPSITMSLLKSLGLRCMILTSGTLSPLDTFASELGVPFPVRLENPHVIARNQVFAAVVKESPPTESGAVVRLSSAYRARGEETQLALGRVLIRVASIIPDGLLVFFPSYGTMNLCTELWRSRGPGENGAKPSVWEHLLRRKNLVMEERESSKFGAALLAHRTNVDSGNGSILFAVCRGKVSEGIDFSDHYGRAVIITGLPFPSAGDPRIKLKRQIADKRYRDFRSKQRNCGSPEKVLSGSEWYTVQAIRAVNQAVGRAIRHKNDYGVILLCDERFNSFNLQGQLSKWLRPHISRVAQFGNLETSVSNFFESAKASQYAQKCIGKGATKNSGTENQRVHSAEIGSDSSAVLLAQEAISRIIPRDLSNEELLVRASELAERVKSSRESEVQQKSNASDSKRLIPWNYDQPISGNDSAILERDNGNGLVESRTPSHASKFLHQRLAGREIRHGHGNSVDDPSNQPVTKKPRQENGQEQEALLSQRARAIFKTKEDMRKFGAIFRQILAASKTSIEAKGPLSAGKNGDGFVAGVDATRNIVRFTRKKTETSGPAGIVDREQFLRDLRQRIPTQFRDIYDKALSNRSQARGL